MRRRPAGPGLSYFDANRNRLITETAAVSDVKREIEACWPDTLSVYFDTWQEEWVVVEHCPDGVDRFVLATKALNQSTLDKLHRIDATKHPQPNINDKLDSEDAQAEKERDDALTESIGEGAERLFWELRKSDFIHAPQVFMT